MTALSQAIRLNTRVRGVNTYEVAAGEIIYFGALVCVNTAGFAVAHANTAGHEFRGIASGSVSKGTGADATASLPNLPFESVDGDKSGTYGEASFVSVDERGLILEKYTVAGSDQSNVGELVYSTTDNAEDDLTDTLTANVGAVGHGVRFYSGTTMDVELFTPAEHLCLN